jgi:GntR family transcriptional regulator/MocR family aminotransferase
MLGAVADHSRRGRSGPELLAELDRVSKTPLRVQLERSLRRAIRERWLPPGARLPSTRALAADLGVSRRLVVVAYEQLAAEGYLVSRAGSGTLVAPTGRQASTPAAAAPAVTREAARFDFAAGIPDLSTFPRAAWARTLRQVLRVTPDAALRYPDPQGAPELRAALAGYLRRARGVDGGDDRIVVTLGYSDGLWALGHALRIHGVHEVAVEDPGAQNAYAALRMSGVRTIPVPVDEEGVDIEALARSGARAVVVTPAHQFPTGVSMSAARRAALLRWADEGGLVVEDDYDAEFRYDRTPIGALQGLSPEQVAYLGSTSKTLAPALRLGWLVVPARLLRAVVEPKRTVTRGCPVLDQLVLAELIGSAAYDRHLRVARRRYRRRRDALAEALEPTAVRIEGVAAGLHAVVRLPAEVDAGALCEAARRRSVAVAPMSAYCADPADGNDALVVGYAALGERAIREGVTELLGAAAELGTPLA